MTHYKIKGTIELGAGLPENLEIGDSLTDNSGKGRTVYINQCSICKKLLFGPTLILIPFSCDECLDFYDKIDKGYYDWVSEE